MYYYRGHGLEKMTFGEEEVAELLDVFSGELSCCRHGHPDAQTCDREELVLPMLGLFIEIYRTRRNGDATPKTRRAYAAMEPLLAQMYPATFEYRRIHGDGSETKETCPLFGGLIEAAKFFVDHEDTPDAEMPALPDFEPGTHARRHSRAKPRRPSGGDSVKSGHSLATSKTSSSFRRSRSFSALTQIRSLSTSATNRSERSVASLPPTKSRTRFVPRDGRGDGHDEDSSSSLSARARGSPHQSRPSFGSMASRRYLPDV